ncbi:PfkB family carbohydrate kinase [Microcella daejeonensis]|uniref:carbohydrate kinase family protein n=1 Tax=Microcella daejeonensis TaxID=2994971 RepID=UPI002271580D|nr:PfkB family carbohydrate kinase [Microcella daejeonensis]WAB84697.1 PfkB family carbohydrate kinase [Microcella daejeonensis]
MTGSIVCVGTALLDTIAVVDGLPGEDGRAEAEQVVLAGGGNASTSAVTIARLGVDVDFAGVVGADDIGQSLVAQLQAEGVGTRHVEVREGIETTHSVVIVTRSTAARTIITRPATAPRSIPRGYDWVHVDKLGYSTLRADPHHGSRVAIDDGNAVPDLDLALIDLYVPTASVLSDRYHGVGLEAAARRALKAGPSAVVATAGSRGSFVVTEALAEFAPALRIDPVSTLGAGDVFHGAILAAILLGKSLPAALRFANVTAALSCRAIDGRSGIPTRGEVEDVLRELPEQAGDPTPLIDELFA